MAQAVVVSGKDLLPTSQTAIFSLYPQTVKQVSALSYKGTDPIHKSSTLVTYSPLKLPHLLIPSHRRLRFQHVDFGKHKHLLLGCRGACCSLSSKNLLGCQPHGMLEQCTEIIGNWAREVKDIFC